MVAQGFLKAIKIIRVHMGEMQRWTVTKYTFLSIFTLLEYVIFFPWKLVT